MYIKWINVVHLLDFFLKAVLCQTLQKFSNLNNVYQYFLNFTIYSFSVQIRRTVFLTNQTNALNCSETIN